MENVRKAGDLLTSLFSERFDRETLENARISAELFSNSWAAAAKQAQISAACDHCRIRELERGILVIEAEHPGWVQILQTKQKYLLGIFQKKFPELKIQGLSFCLSREPISGLPKSAAAAFPPETAAEPETYDPQVDKSLHESLNKFKKVIQKRNRNNPEDDVQD
ncbi:MAG: DUF721 domain-containing protein [Treponema sp.]|nr:DUF721 domain-containing protein [Treponema sp.]